ncbi:MULTISPECIES: ROK family transcriptional regulator [Arthrobacter]|uniref:ROK family transcriptional regulator n=2 Tax=Arthrobacter TaxID=1663 RepID=A0ABU9KH66_9MICC|nr:ROK family transcriptional regulator [Arthrobacter sp. YJM1]MDP5226162.1 ROK family transcriptional regulator [Arthrobacter sp. YJM1]
MTELRTPASRRGTNLPKMGDFNLTVILDTIRRSPHGLSRVELAGLVGLSPQTISNISRRLLDQGLIVEAGKAGVGPGKPRTILQLNPSGMYALGVHVDPAVISFTLLDLVGQVVMDSKIDTPEAGEPTAVMAAIVFEVQRLLEESEVDLDKVAGLGVAAPGPIDVEAGTVVNPPLLEGWSRVHLRDALSKATGLAVVLDKDVTAAAVAETWVSKTSGNGNFAVFYMGTGIGCGLVLGDEVFRGASGNAGEMGHIVVDPSGPPCDCGLNGCVKSTVIPKVLVDAAAQAGLVAPLAEGDSGVVIQERFNALCDAADAGDAAAIAILDRSALHLSRAVSVIANVMDLDRVVFGGPFWTRLAPYYLERIPGLVAHGADAREIHVPKVLGSTVGEDVGAIGAACLVLEHTLAPRSERLLLGG